MGYVYVIKEKMRQSELMSHETKRHSLGKFIFLLLFLIAYFLFISKEYGVGSGIVITALTWSFFVLCTPIADAGFLIDFPVRVFADIRMFYTEVAVWVMAIAMNVYALTSIPEIYSKTFLLKLLSYILLHPYPFWGIVVLCGIGTFISIYLGDELMDIVSYNERERHSRHKFKHDLVVFLFIILAVIALYDFLLKELGIEIPF